MSRGQRGNFDSGGHSLSMLAVLLCAAGALVVLLSAVGRHNRLHAPVAQAPSEDMQAAREVLNWRVEQLKEAREKTAAQLREDRLKLSHLEDHSRRLREQLARLVASADQLQNVGAASTEYKRREAQHELEEIRRLIARTQDELAAMKQKGQGKSTAFSIVPYVGPNGTRRRPIFIECRSESIIIQPENIILGEGDFLGPMGPGNPLASALRALREYLVEQQAALAAEKMEPYPLLLVRPDGILMYYAARNALSTWGNEFGYELIEQHWELKYPDPDPQQADLVRRVIDDARVKQRQLALSAPRHFGKNGSGNGKTAYRASARGGFVPDTSGGSRNSGGSPGAGGGLAGRPRSPGGSGRSSSGGGVAGGVASQGGATGERTAGQSGNSAPQQPSFADEPFAMNDKAKGSSSAASNGPSSSGDPGGEEKTRDKKPPVKSLSESRGTDWGLPDAARGAVAVSRPVAVYCYPDRLIIMPERGIGGGKTIMMSGGTQDSVDELVAGVWEHIKTWGIAGKGLYWKPTLSMDVQPGAAGRYSDLESLLQDSGLDVKQRGARSPETAAPKTPARR